MDYLHATYTNSTGLGTLVTLASTYVPSKVACTYTYDASQLRKFNHLHEQQLSHCSCMQFWALQRPVHSLITLVCNHTSTNLLPTLDMYYSHPHIYHTKISMNMCLNDHSRSSPRTFWALSPPCILENLFIPWDQKWDEIVSSSWVFWEFFRRNHLFNQPYLRRTVGHNHILLFFLPWWDPRSTDSGPCYAILFPFL
jgi:hypothetical protein